MSAVEEVTIVLEHDIDEQYQYAPGEIIRGKVRVQAARNTAIRTITLRVVGEGNVSWRNEDDGEGGGGKQHQAEEKYVDVSQVVLESERGAPCNLVPGYTDFPFQYQLPDNLPSSYIGKFGNVTYTMKASLTGVASIDTAITSEPFLVLRRSQLPPSASQSVHLTADRRFWGSCTFGKVSASLTLESSGGVPGEDIFMHAEVRNLSARTVTAIQASVMMISSYHAQSNTVGFSQVVSKKRDEFDVGQGEGRRWNYVRLPLPPYIPETGLDHCDIIDIHYVFQFRAELTGGAELRMECPLLIGSHFQGQESRGHLPTSANPNVQWSIRKQGFLPGDDTDKIAIDLGGGVESNNPWGFGSSRVPELQDEWSVVQNPLFQQGPFETRPTGRNGKEVPAEQMEKTRL